MGYLDNENLLDYLSKNDFVGAFHNADQVGLEKFVMYVIRDYIAREKKNIEIYEHDFMFDAILPNGIGDISEPAYFEIVTQKIDIKKYISGLVWKFNHMPFRNITRVFFVYLDTIDHETQNLIAGLKSESLSIDYWDVHDFNNKTNDIWSKYSKYLTMAHKAVIEDAVQTGIDNRYILSNDVHKRVLIKSYNDENLVLVFGAGVSIDANIPKWDDLVKQLLVRMINVVLREKNEELSDSNVQKLIELAYGNMEGSQLAQMRYIKSALSETQYFDLLHDVLYEDTESVTDLLESIARICMPRRRHIGVKSIITYNFDDLVERALTRHNVRHASIVSDEDVPALANLNIYHVHGYMPYERLDTVFDTNIVFSEEDYHRVYRDAYCWSNIVQLNAFRENTCLFIGCSFNDPNMRRMLDIATRKGDKPRHFAMLRRKQYTTQEADNESNDALEMFKRIDLSITDEYFKTLGINVIWVDAYSDIPELLNEMVEAR